MSTKLTRISEKAKLEPKLCFTALAHLITPDFLKETWRGMNRRATSGVDGVSTEEFESQLDRRCEDLVARLKARRYQAPPVRRVEIPKGDGKTRPLGIPTVEDRLLQRAVSRILEAIFEADFLPCSYGFRPGRSPHQALRELRNQLMTSPVGYIFETDIRGFFNHLSHGWLMRMLKLRIGDPVILRLVGKWLRAGALIDGIVLRTGEGTPQGGPISPILANIYLHYALDLWFEKRFVRSCRGKAYLIRFADDYIAGFRHLHEAARFAAEAEERMKKFGLELAPEKTRLMPFGRATVITPGLKKESFDFLGFRHVCGRDSKGRFAIIRTPTIKSRGKFLNQVKQWLRTHTHWGTWFQQKQLAKMLQGFYQYFGLHGCGPKLWWVMKQVQMRWVWALRRRGQRHRIYWSYVATQEWFKLPKPTVVHPTV